MTVSILPGNKLYSIAHKSDSATRVITALGLRERSRRTLDIPKFRYQLLKQGEKIVDADYMQVWKDLQDAGMGVIVHGRDKKPDQFMWHYDLKRVASAALEGKAEQTTKLEEKRKPGRPSRQEVERKSNRPETKKIIFPLRENFDFTLEVPKDIKKEEVTHIIEILNVVIK